MLQSIEQIKLTEIIETNNPTNLHHMAIENSENTCFNCLQLSLQIYEILIPALNHNSKFTNFSTILQLCNNCFKLTNPEWWKLEIIKTYSENNMMQLRYKYEKEILDFVNQMPIEGRELFYARFGNGANADHMSGQDWIDYVLDILPHEKCKLYGCFSPDEIKSYQKRFPICDKVKKVIYENEEFKEYNIFKLRCPFGVDDNQTQSQCYECKLFVERNGEIEIMDKEDFEFYELHTKLRLKILNRKEQ